VPVAVALPTYHRPVTTVGLLGCGRWGRFILRDLLQLGVDVVVVDPDDGAREAAQACGATSVAEVVQAPEVEGFVVATPASLHAATLGELLPYGLPAFVEKPMTADLASARALSRSWGDRLHVMEKWRYHPGIEALAAAARSGELGGTLGLRTTRVDASHSHADVDVFWGLLPHDLSIAAEVLGSIPEPRSCHADVRAGSAVALWAVLGEGPWHVAEVSAAAPERRRRVELHGEDGVAVVDCDSDVVELHLGRTTDGFRSVERRPVGSELPLRRELDAFVRHLAGGPPPKASAADGLAAVEAVVRLRGLAGLEAS
jgi:predicted dehydrogenase